MANAIPVPELWAKTAHCDNEKYLKMYDQSVKDPEGFRSEAAKMIDWIKPFKKVKDGSFT